MPGDLRSANPHIKVLLDDVLTIERKIEKLTAPIFLILYMPMVQKVHTTPKIRCVHTYAA